MRCSWSISRTTLLKRRGLDNARADNATVKRTLAKRGYLWGHRASSSTKSANPPLGPGDPPSGNSFPDCPVPSPLEEYLFDLQGFLLFRGALSIEEVAACNAIVDGIPESLERGEWWGHVQQRTTPSIGAAAPADLMHWGGIGNPIDHPSWINYVFRFVGGQAPSTTTTPRSLSTRTS